MTSPTLSTSGLTTARMLAAAHPQAKLPCPVCAVSLRAKNLDKHLATAHKSQAPTLAWVGIDRRMMGASIGALVATIIILGIVLASSDLKSDEARTMVLPFLPVIFIPLVMLLMAASGRFKARISVTGDALRLRRTLGLRERVVRLPASIEIGRMTETRGNAALSTYNDEMHVDDGKEELVGTYLRLGAGRAGMIIGCRQKTGFRHHWDPKGWRAGPAYNGCDIEVKGPILVAIEYMLAERGLLSPRTD
ncbi:hypothetical protein OV203_10445 [Nannocystis sp. ILAH1]|uniref:hypothetical protein n=1 Tax=Nannocystis sp. ILAH1 TaxID=2996789 RepID=UPI00226E83A8|nr:hypothetical protein [Nannocystis sp. ILAH1]MCY0987544.1 hypothetical protein [Nannocystis sp. ILAH1]